MWASSAHVFLMQLANWARTSVDRVLVGMLLGPAAATRYGITMQAHEMIRLLVLTVGAASNAGLAHLFGEGNVERFKRVISIRYALQGAAVAIGLGGVLAFNGPFVSAWVDPGAYAGHWVNALAVIATGSFIICTVPYDGLQARGEFSLLSRALIIDSLVRVPSIVALLFAFGMAGASAGNAIAQSLALTLPLALSLAERLGQSRRELWLDIGLRVTRIALPVGLLALATLLLAPRAGGWGALIAQGAVFTLVAAGLVAVVDRPLTRFVLLRGRV
jgi:O-antigen/teichoic acid export membrane protein